MSDGLWVESQGEVTWVSYDELDTDARHGLLKPIGGFCYASESFLQLPLPRVPFYIQDWLPKHGKMVIYGQAKVGKSFLCLQLARCIGIGVPFLGVRTCKGKVLYLQFELGTGVLQSRMRATGEAYENVLVGTSFDMKLDAPYGREHLDRALVEIQPDVLILDPLYKVLRGDESESHDVLTVLDYLDSVIDTYDMSVVIMHHTGKDISRGARGSSVLEGYPDALIEMRRSGGMVKITPKLLRHAELPPEPILLTLQNFEFTPAEGELTIEERVKRFIRNETQQGRTSKVAQMSAHFGCTRKPVYDALAKLVEAAMVEKSGRGDYLWVSGDYTDVNSYEGETMREIELVSLE